MCYQISADWPMGMNTVKNVNAKRAGGRGSLVQDAWNIKMQWAGQSCWREHSGDAVWRSLDWAKCRGQGRIIKRLEHTPSGITEGRMGNINRELYLLGKARRWKHWLRLFCWLGGTLWFMCWWRSSIYCTKAVPRRQLKWDQTLGALPAPPGSWERVTQKWGSLVDSGGDTFQGEDKELRGFVTLKWLISSWSKKVAYRRISRLCGERAATGEIN